MDEQPVLIDVHVQKDLFLRGGSLYRPQTANVTANVYRLFRWARTHRIPVISMLLQVRARRRGPFGRRRHCVEGSGGEVKPSRTLLTRRVNLGLAHTPDLPEDIFDQYQQVLFETRNVDPFAHQKFERLITELPQDRRFILCGATVASGIKQTVLGLRSRGYDVVIAEDAVLGLSEPGTNMAWLQMLAKNAEPRSTDEIVRGVDSSHPAVRPATRVMAG